MRLWAEQLISMLPRQQLLGQHRECAALRGRFWGRNHSTVSYVWQYSPLRLFRYHQKVIKEMERRGYKVDNNWKDPLYRGKNCRPWLCTELGKDAEGDIVYPEHDNEYIKECLLNLQNKGIDLKEAI